MPKITGTSKLRDVLRPKKGPRPPHLVVEARAGTGKTTTLIEGLKLMRGIEPSIVPSPQQAAVWEQMMLSKGVQTIGFCAFSKSIASELKTRVPPGVDAMTMHALGLRAVTKALGPMGEPSQYVVGDIVAELLGVDKRVLKRSRPLLLSAVEELVSLCKVNLVGFPRPESICDDFAAAKCWQEELDELVAHYDVEIDLKSRVEVFQLVPSVLEECRSPRGRMDFDDMIWLPVVLDLPVFRYDLLLVDEAQDLNRCQQALAKKAGERLILVGDPRQAIYGFAGADAESMPRMVRELNSRCDKCGMVNQPGGLCHDCGGYTFGPGCVILPLTVTRRCGKAIVEEARKIVPDFEAHESNPSGIISKARFKEDDLIGPITENGKSWRNYRGDVQDGNMVLCRVNAPLVSECFKFIREGRRANIQGRDVAKGLTSTVKRMDALNATDLVHKLSDWSNEETKKESVKRNPSENRLIAIKDKFDCLMCFVEGAKTVADVLSKIETMFTDDKSGEGIKLSSIHRAKGLEAKRVFFLMPKGGECPHPMAKTAWQKEQERNLFYVAVTRAIEELVFVS